MKIGSYIQGGRPSYGVLAGGGIVDLGRRLGDKYPDLLACLKAFALDEAMAAAAGQSPDFAEDDVIHLPIIPSPVNVYCAGINYLDHIEETGSERPEFPTIFLKTEQAFVGHNQPIIRPRVSEQFDFEGEFAIVIGKPGRHIKSENWLDHVAGYTLLMDGSIRDFQRLSVDAGKNFFHSSSSGPWMVTRDEVPDFADMAIETRLNGEVMQRSSIDQLCFDVGDLMAYYSQIFQFQPGDIISTGTPGGVGARRDPPLWMKAGDELEIEISGIGVLRNPIIDES